MARAKALKPMDAAWMYVDSANTPMQVGVLSIFSLPENAEPTLLRDMFAQLRSVEQYAPPFNLKLRSARMKRMLPSWVEAEQIDLDYHLRHSALPAPGGERELGVLISRLHSHPMDFTRPLWEMHIIEGLENKRFALYMKMHHALVDGVGGMRMLQRMLSPDPATRELLPPWAVGSGRKTSRAVEAQTRRFAETVRVQGSTVPKVARALAHVVRESVQHNDPQEATPFSGPRSVLNGKVSGHRRFATQHYDLTRVRAVAKAGGVTVNDVFLALCAGAVRRYLAENGALPRTPLTAGVPVSIRPADDQNAGNAISFIIANLNTDVADPIERLRAIHVSTRVAKAHLQQLPKAGLDGYTMFFMAPFLLQLLYGLGGRVRPMFNLTISNVPGPDRPLYFNGARMEQIYPVSLLSHGQALNITSVSYDGQFNIGYTGCREALPSMQRLAVYTGEALDELEQKLGLAAAPVENRPARKKAAVRKSAPGKAAAKKTTAPRKSASRRTVRAGKPVA